MALRHTDSFDDRTSDANVQRSYDVVFQGTSSTVTISAGNGRNGTAALKLATTLGSTSSAGYVQKRLPASGQTYIAHFSWKTNVLPTAAYGIHSIMDGGTIQFWLRLNTDGTVSAMSGTTVLGTSTATIATSTEYYFSLKVVVDTTTGTVDLDVYNAGTPTTFLTLSAQNTCASAVEQWTGFRHGWNSGNTAGQTANTTVIYTDDLIIMDGSGSVNNDRLGDKRVAWRKPASDYAGGKDFTRSTGSDNFANVDDSDPDGDSTYNKSTTNNHRDLFVMENLPISPSTIYGYQFVMWGKMNNPKGVNIAGVMRDNVSGTEYAETAQGVSAEHWAFTFPRDTNPATSARITESESNGHQFGYKRVDA